MIDRIIEGKDSRKDMRPDIITRRPPFGSHGRQRRQLRPAKLRGQGGRPRPPARGRVVRQVGAELAQLGAAYVHE
jgi:hypothetical protein